ncbi:MAG: 50S ribosomal protein L23 [Nitrososphaerales archaeon]|nr:50S ribosomal protein L23 [Nitrososphaerales archaeon]
MRPEEALQVILRPYVTERTFDLIERQNKIVFLVKNGARKRKIRDAVEMLYDVDVASVNTANTLSGKKAYVRLSEKSSATDLASKLGLV